MKIVVNTETDLTPYKLAEALVRSDPRDFADFWFRFADIVRKENIDLRPFAAAMAPSFGAMRQEPLRLLCKLMDAEEYRNEILKKAAGGDE